MLFINYLVYYFSDQQLALFILDFLYYLEQNYEERNVMVEQLVVSYILFSDFAKQLQFYQKEAVKVKHVFYQIFCIFYQPFLLN